MKKLILFTLLSVFFTGVVFIYKNSFFSRQTDSWVSHHIVDIQESYDHDHSDVELNAPHDLDSQLHQSVFYSFYPETFEEKVSDYQDQFHTVLQSDDFENKIWILDVELHEEKTEVRGRMKNKTIQFFWVLEMPIEEFVSVWVHEFAHYIDLYYLQKKIARDISDEFYEVSWKTTKIMNSNFFMN